MNLNDYEFEDEDFVIRVRPTLDKEEWTGEIDVTIMSNGISPLDDDDFEQLMHFCKMVCSSIPLMENNVEVRDTLHDYVLEVVNQEYEVEEKEELIVTGEDGNVIHLNFNSKTGGSA